MPLPVPSPRTFSVQEVEVAAYLNAVRDALTFLVNPPIATCFQGISQGLGGSGTTVMITYDSTAVDTYGGHSNTVNNSEYVSQAAGWYLITGGVCWGPTPAAPTGSASCTTTAR